MVLVIHLLQMNLQRDFFGKNGGKPAVIGLDAKRLLKDGYSTSRSLTGFFPPVKLRTQNENSSSKTSEKAVLKLRINPCRDKPENHISKPLSLSLELGPIRRESATLRQNNTVKPEYCVQAPVEPERLVRESSRGDLTALPRPRMVVRNNESPWIFRQKVKQGMNGLSRLVASRTPTNSSKFMYLHY